MTPKQSNTKLHKLARCRNIDEFKSTNTHPLTVDTNGNTILHLASKYGNIDLVNFLLSNNGRNALNITTSITGMTPLMIAIINHQYDIVKILLDSQPDISVRNSRGMTALQIAVRQKLPSDVIQKFIELLKKLNVPSIRIVLMLERSYCTLKYALNLHDTSLLRILLERQESISYRESSSLIREAMNYTSKASVDNLITLLRYGPGRNIRKVIFFREIGYDVDGFFPSFNASYVKSLTRQLMKANAIDPDFVVYLAKEFSEANQSAVKIWLDCEVHNYVKERYARDLLAHLFGNRRVKAIELTSKLKLDVNGKGSYGYSALHFAVGNDLRENVEFLLNKGADANCKSDLGMTPMFLAYDRKCTKLLLEYGADVQVVDVEGLTILDVNRTVNTHELVIANFAIVEAKGDVVMPYMIEKINGNRRFNKFYVKCRLQIEWMKRRRIFQSITLFDAFIGKPDNIARYVVNKEKGLDFMDWYYECPLIKYYFDILKGKLKRAVRIYKLRCKAAIMISRLIRIWDVEHLVVRKIVQCLSYEDLLVFD